MAVDDQLLDKARRNPGGLSFDEAVTLAKQLGWTEKRQQGSHHILHHPRAPLIRDKYPQPLNLQKGKSGEAKEYQVEQMLQMATAMEIIHNQK